MQSVVVMMPTKCPFSNTGNAWIRLLASCRIASKSDVAGATVMGDRVITRSTFTVARISSYSVALSRNADGMAR